MVCPQAMATRAKRITSNSLPIILIVTVILINPLLLFYYVVVIEPLTTTITSPNGITHAIITLNLIHCVISVTVIFYYDLTINFHYDLTITIHYDLLIITIPPPPPQSPSGSRHSTTARHNTQTQYPLI